MERLKSIKKHKHGRRTKQLEKLEQKMKEERQKRIRERQKEFFGEIEVHKCASLFSCDPGTCCSLISWSSQKNKIAVCIGFLGRNLRTASRVRESVGRVLIDTLRNSIRGRNVYIVKRSTGFNVRRLTC